MPGNPPLMSLRRLRQASLLLVTLVVVAAWCGGCFTPIRIGWTRVSKVDPLDHEEAWDFHARGVRLSDGLICVGWARDRFFDKATASRYVARAGFYFDTGGRHWSPLWIMFPSTIWHRLGFGSSDVVISELPGHARSGYVLPFWFVAMMLLPFWAVVTSSMISRWRRRAARRCPACGYDLRATPDRCPECGTKALKSAV